jgi:hypothetical protein
MLIEITSMGCEMCTSRFEEKQGECQDILYICHELNQSAVRLERVRMRSKVKIYFVLEAENPNIFPVLSS